MGLMEKIWSKAKSDLKVIALPEGSEPRTLRAAEIIKKEGLAEIILLGDESEIKNAAQKEGANIEGIKIIDPKTSEKSEFYAQQLYELRKSKGMTIEKAREMILDTMYFGAMMVKLKDADGMVSGAVHSTGDLLRPGMQIIKTAPGISIVSSVFVMEVPNEAYGEKGLFVFGDCAVNPNPTASELASIAVTSARTAKVLCGIEPKVAMLSFSTKGSAKHELVDKVVEATKLAKEMAPDIMIDGELQLDAAIVPKVASLKAPGSDVAGKANVLIFPDLQAGNIGYKLVQRLANAEAIGPICQGFAAPINDLSRGCSVEDIVNVVAITAVQAQGINL
ncbi:phosphate acetyltransferase [Caloramator quimbayensis]|uniref:Phosphate acetyltransferase n=1 Tax=Caloramator quimbayensis TaxID=1147123 RepID=A0A1T4XRU4_9CLOT|nr:phosphate acetyltransferase [Caloramator quimbayensis]SKA92282.1 phosphate acetyltransferase [Caloramator quimbayensis]